MEKSKEIEILQSLKGDTYFNDTFSSQDIDNMCENIKNDFPIDNGLNYKEELKKEISDLKDEVKNLKESRMNLKYELIKTTMIILGSNLPQQLYDEYVNYVGKLGIIKIKQENGLKVTKEEIDYLLSIVKQEFSE